MSEDTKPADPVEDKPTADEKPAGGDENPADQDKVGKDDK